MRMTYLPKVAKTNPNRLARANPFDIVPVYWSARDGPGMLRASILPFQGSEKLIQSTDTPLALIGAAHFSISVLTKRLR